MLLRRASETGVRVEGVDDMCLKVQMSWAVQQSPESHSSPKRSNNALHWDRPKCCGKEQGKLYQHRLMYFLRTVIARLAEESEVGP